VLVLVKEQLLRDARRTQRAPAPANRTTRLARSGSGFALGRTLIRPWLARDRPNTTNAIEVL